MKPLDLDATARFARDAAKLVPGLIYLPAKLLPLILVNAICCKDFDQALIAATRHARERFETELRIFALAANLDCRMISSGDDNAPHFALAFGAYTGSGAEPSSKVTSALRTSSKPFPSISTRSLRPRLAAVTVASFPT